MEEKLISITIPSSKDEYSFQEIDEINELIKQGYKIKSIIPGNSCSDYSCVFIIHLK